MRLPTEVRKVEVFYDGRCGRCCTFHEWINRQPRTCEIEFIPYQAAKANEIFPGIEVLDPAKEMIVRTDQNEIYRAAEAWVLCLYSCANQQGLARRLASPTLLKIAIRTCRILAENRQSLSKVFFNKKDKEVKKALHQMQAPDCHGDFCSKDS
jgi:predicted DCC family thiol-disulfide oxidoreductase YuxK